MITSTRETQQTRENIMLTYITKSQITSYDFDGNHTTIKNDGHHYEVNWNNDENCNTVVVLNSGIVDGKTVYFIEIHALGCGSEVKHMISSQTFMTIKAAKEAL